MDHPIRKYPRLKEFDYTTGGVFCVTICSKDKKQIFGRIMDGENAGVELSPLGQLVCNAVCKIENAYPGVRLLNWVVMPNHVHLLIQISTDEPASLYDVVRSTKAIVTRQWGSPVWQRSFYEHVVRGEQDALRYWKYIDENPKKWTLDKYYS